MTSSVDVIVVGPVLVVEPVVKGLHSYTFWFDVSVFLWDKSETETGQVELRSGRAGTPAGVGRWAGGCRRRVDRDVAAQVEIESKVSKQCIVCRVQVLNPSAASLG